MIAKHHVPGTVSPRREFHKHFRTQGRGLDNRSPPRRISRFGFSIPGTGGAESGLERAWNWDPNQPQPAGHTRSIFAEADLRLYLDPLLFLDAEDLFRLLSCKVRPNSILPDEIL
jgi:hypothetical protein